MIERIYVLEDADIEQFAGENKCNLSTLGNLFPRAKLRLHGNVIKILASGEEADNLLKIIERLEEICVHFNHLTEEHIISVVRSKDQSPPPLARAQRPNHTRPAWQGDLRPRTQPKAHG